MIQKLKNILTSKVFANYSHMTVSQLVNVVVSLCIYPIVIRILGAEVYGVYVFAVAIMYNMKVFVDFGLTTPVVKRFIDCNCDREGENKVVTVVVMVRCAFFMLLFGLLLLTVSCVPMLRDNACVYLVVAMQIVADIFSFAWVYQARQKMHIVTYINICAKVVSIPLILLFVKSPSDLYVFALLNSAFLLLGAFFVTMHLLRVEKLRLVRVTTNEVKSILAEGLPFISSDLIGTIRNEVAVLFVGSYLGMREVAIYDLANKIISVPRTFIVNINRALYPDVLSTNKYDVRRLIRYEYLLGMAVIVAIALFGYWAVLLLGGAEMTEAYGVSVILSASILTWLVAEAYVNFVFVPSRRYNLVTKKQVFAVCCFLVVCIPLMYIFCNVYAFTISLVLSEAADMLYCRYATRRLKLL